VTPALFARYPDARAFAEADRAELETMIHSTGFYRNKAKNVQEACTRIVAVYDGQVPATMDDLLSLAGVARKTANVVLGTAYHIADGIVVDTHVKRLAQRLGLSTTERPGKDRTRLAGHYPARGVDRPVAPADLSRAPRLRCAQTQLSGLCDSPSLPGGAGLERGWESRPNVTPESDAGRGVAYWC
jgi:hypothetical protein